MPDKPIVFWGSSKQDLTGFPDDAKSRAGYQLRRVQQGREPDNWKALPDVGSGVTEIRIETGDAFRVIYIAKHTESIYVLHAFQKMTRKTPKNDLNLARKRLKEIETTRREQLKSKKR